VNRVANDVKTTISDNRNTGNEDNHIADIIAQNRTQKKMQLNHDIKNQLHPERLKQQRHYT